jgi:hypothetical protein
VVLREPSPATRQSRLISNVPHATGYSADLRHNTARSLVSVPTRCLQKARRDRTSKPVQLKHDRLSISSTKSLPCWLNSSCAPPFVLSNVFQNADLDRQTLSICISLIENGVNPEALAVGLCTFGFGRDLPNIGVVCYQGAQERR